MSRSTSSGHAGRSCIRHRRESAVRHRRHSVDFRAAIASGSVYVGSPETVATKVAAAIRALGLSRFDLVYGLASEGPPRANDGDDRPLGA